MQHARRAAHILTCAAVVYLFPVVISAQTPPSRPSVEVFGELPQIRQPSLSPDGKHLATIQVYKGRPGAVIRTLDPAGQPPVIIPYDQGYIVSALWANNDRLLVTVNMNAQMWVDTQVNAWYRTASMDSKGQNAVSMFSDQRDAKTINRSASSIVDLNLDDPDNIYMSLWASEDPSKADFSVGMTDIRHSVFRVNVTTGRSHREFVGGTNTAQWIMDGHGHPVARIDQFPNPLRDHLLLRQPDETWKEVASADASGGEGLAVFGLTEDGTALVESVA